MNAYEAIMATADLLERNPDKFQFSKSTQPRPGQPGTGDGDSNERGCALGWIGHFSGVRSDMRAAEISTEVLAMQDFDFYRALIGAQPAGLDWRRDAANCVAALRNFAENFKRPEDEFKAWLAKVMAKGVETELSEYASISGRLFDASGAIAGCDCQFCIAVRMRQEVRTTVSNTIPTGTYELTTA